MAFMVTTPHQVASGELPEEYAHESTAEARARELVALGKGPAVVYEVGEGENWPRARSTASRSDEQGAVVHGGRREAEGAAEAQGTRGAA